MAISARPSTMTVGAVACVVMLFFAQAVLQVNALRPMLAPTGAPIYAPESAPEYAPEIAPVTWSPEYAPEIAPVTWSPEYAPEIAPVTWSPEYTPEIAPVWSPEYAPEMAPIYSAEQDFFITPTAPPGSIINFTPWILHSGLRSCELEPWDTVGNVSNGDMV
jgi:hypothetical protein